jgi:hypothetical protein
MTYLNISLFVLIVIRQCANVQYATTESGLVWLVLRLKDYFLSQFLDHYSSSLFTADIATPTRESNGFVSSLPIQQ